MTARGEPIAFSDELRRDLQTGLEAHDRRAHRLEARHRAAVAIVLVDSDHAGNGGGPVLAEGVDVSLTRDRRGLTLDQRMRGVGGGAAFLLCRRAPRMNRHAGQWALPGGRVDAGETPLDAALRELDEELALRLAPDSLLGALDDYPTRSGYVITPLVLWCGADPALRPAPDEVAAVFRIGLHALRDSEPRFLRIPESDRPVLQLPLGGDRVHAPTGAILYQLRQVGLLHRHGERVDHLEQPVFAWR